MSRNLVDANSQFFQDLDRYYGEQRLPLATHGKIRFVKTNEEEKEFAKKSKLKDIFFRGTERQIAVFTHKNTTWFCCSGFRFLSNDPQTFDEYQTELDAGVFTALFAERCVRPIATLGEVRDVVDFGYLNDGNGYAGHDFSELAALFPDITIFTLPTETCKKYFQVALKLSILEKTNDYSDFSTRIGEGLIDFLEQEIDGL
ncbi:MAG: hypothetical protein ACPG5W_06535, partial [Flavobacteriales bacterium]